MTKFCLHCDKQIQEFNDSEKWAMIITKQGQRITSFECFHAECWEGCFEEACLEYNKE